MNKIFLVRFLWFIPVIFVLPIILPYFHVGFFPTHDGEWAVVRLADMFRSLRDLQFPVRFSGALNFGYGYPLFNFAYPLPYYLGILFYMPFHSFIFSIKAMFVLSVFFSAIFMYLASGTLWKNKWAGVVSSILYIYLPYRMVDLYVRGSLGESLSFALFPLIFYLSLRLFETKFLRITIVLLSLSVSALIMTHNIMSILFLPLLTIFILAKIFIDKKQTLLKYFLLSLFFGVVITTFFWFPALFEKNNILLSQIPIADRNLYFVHLSQLIIPSWGYGSPNEPGGFSYQLGVVHILVVILTAGIMVHSFLKKKAFSKNMQYAATFFILYLLCFLMLFSFTSQIWRIVPLLREINYPWVFLSQLGFIASLLSGFILVQNRVFRYAMFAMCAIAVLLTYPYAKPSMYVDRGDGFYSTNEATTTSSNELMPLWVKKMPVKHFDEKIEVIKGSAEIQNVVVSSKKIQFDYTAHEPVTFRVNTIYYPGWEALENTKRKVITYDNSFGVMDVQAIQNKANITLVFKETSSRMLANSMSVLGFIALILFLTVPKFKIKQ